MKRLFSFLVVFCLSVGIALAAYDTPAANSQAKNDSKMGVPQASSPEFNRVKEWVGKWEGDSNGHGKTEKVSIEYTVTSGGTAVEEKLFAGTPHEMVSMYYDNKNGKVGMTHFCMLGNRPHLELKSSDAGKMDFDWIPGGGVDPNEMHMHSLSIAITDKNHITQSWKAYNNGKPMDETTVIALTRVS